MIHIDRSSPNSNHIRSPDLFMKRENHIQKHSPLKKQVSKRRLSDDFNRLKRTKQHTEICSANEYPVFEHPEGGLLQQTPYGNIRLIRDGKSEIASIDRTTTLVTFSNATGDDSPLKKKNSTTHFRNLTQDATNSMRTPSPSCEVESYIIEGYREPELNKSYHHHEEEIVGVNYNLYDCHDEDSHLVESTNDQDCVMTL